MGKSGRCPSCQSRLRLIAPHFREDKDQFDQRLVVESGPEHKGDQPLLAGPGPIEVGKLQGKNILLNGQKVSRTHCRLVRAGDGWRIQDQQRSNGTWVNQSRVAEADLYDGDAVVIGEYVLRFYGRPRPVSAPAASGSGVQAATEPDGAQAGLLDDDLYALADGRLPPPPPETGGPTCPSCERSLAPNAKICIFCGIDLKTGRAILTADEGKLDSIYAKAESIITWLSWIMPIGLYPIASEALGMRKPYVVYGLSILTILTSVMFWVYESDDSPEALEVANYMLWSGTIELSPEELAEEGIESEQGVTLEYRPYQLITHAFLHADLWHLAGNLLFLLVLGSRVNALVGNVATLALYPALGAFAGLAHLVSETGEAAGPMIGASGAVMGMAGMYIVLMPIHKMHMAFWWRFGWIGAFALNLKLFAVRGFWVVLFYIAFDVIYTVLRLETGVAHWAHLGGFFAGAGIGLALLITRVVSARGSDLISALLGQRAWGLVGKPNPEKKPLLQRLP